MLRRICLLLPLAALAALPAGAQTVLFDGLAHDDQAAVLLVPAIIRADDYALQGRFEYGFRERLNLFGLVGGQFNGGATGLAGVGWAATFLRQQDDFVLNFGFFNSFLFPTRERGPDAFVTLAPVFSRSWQRRAGGRLTPYAGVSTTLKIGGRGTDLNGLLGVKVTEVARGWDFMAEFQPGEKSQFAVGLAYRF